MPVILSGYAGLLWWRPRMWLVALPALLPVFDLAPITGWFFLEEIDLLLLLTAGFAYWHLPRGGDDLPRWPLLFRVGLLMLAVAVAVGLWRGLQPLAPLEANYLSSANALRVGKGWLWALVLLPPLRHAGDTLQRYLAPGMMLGLLMVTLAAFCERWQFTGLLNFSSDYRISAPFSAMHTGGAALDGYLAISIPLLATWLAARNAPFRQLAALALLPLAWYVALATFSRGLYLALIVAAIILVLPPARRLVRGPAWRAPLMLASVVLVLMALDVAFRLGGYRAYVPAVLVICAPAAMFQHRHRALVLASLLVVGSVVPILHGYYVNVRFASAGNDWATRQQHWQNTLAMMDADANLFGMGLGKFPATFYWRNRQREIPPSYQFIDQDSEHYLHLVAGQYNAGYGELLRMLQGVVVQPYQQYVLGMDVRNTGEAAFLHANLCQRQLLYPQNCIIAPLRSIPYAPTWQRYEATIHTGPLGSDGLPIKLEIAVEGKRAALDIDNVSLRSVAGGQELLRNGSFSEANNGWFFSSDRNHLPWHIKNLALNLYFDMGGLGLFAYALLLFSAAAELSRRGDTAWLAALAAFQVVGLFDSLLDVPRITILSMLLLCAAALHAKEKPP